MGQFKPHINLPGESTPHAKWLEKFRLDQEKLNSEIIRFMASHAKGASTGARQTTDINVRTRDLENRVDASRTIPQGGEPGGVLRNPVPTGKPAWMPNFAGTTPRLYIHLEDGAPTYEWDVYNYDREFVLPAVVFSDNGRSFDVVSWGPDASLIPIHYDIQVAPHSNGETFTIHLPSYSYALGSGEIGNFNITIHNSWATGFSADVIFGGSVFLFGGFKQFYKDSRLPPWRVAVGPNYENRAVLPSGDQIAWMVEQSPMLENHLSPVLRDTLDALDRSISFPLDFYYWRYVQSRKSSTQIHLPGGLAVTSGKPVGFNDTADSRRIGLVRVTVGTAPTGADLQVTVKIAGTSITTAPVTIPAGQTTAVVEPDAYTHGPAGTHATDVPIGGNCVIWFPGQLATVDVTQVGSSVAGSDLTVQVWAG